MLKKEAIVDNKGEGYEKESYRSLVEESINYGSNQVEGKENGSGHYEEQIIKRRTRTQPIENGGKYVTVQNK